jgi:hypothetical protein
MHCPDGKCDVAARIAAARAGKSGVGASLPLEPRDARNYMPTMPASNAQGGIGIGVIALAILVIIVMRK